MKIKFLENGHPYMAIHGGARVDLIEPDPACFEVESLAFALAREHRYCGNYGEYSVAQHAVLVSQVVDLLGGEQSVILAGLHHDDSEAVTGDLPSPVKVLCPDFKELENRVNKAISLRFGGLDFHHTLVTRADYLVFSGEVHYLIPRINRCNYPAVQRPPLHLVVPTDLEVWSADRAEKQFLAWHYRYYDGYD